MLATTVNVVGYLIVSMYAVDANIVYPETTYFTALLYYLHLLSTGCFKISFSWYLVSSAWSCYAMIKSSVSLLRPEIALE